jgi:hypothetical protein
MGKELRILADLVKDYGPENYPYEVEGEHTITQDFDDRVDIIPVSDPNAGTMAQRIMQYQAALQLAATAPNIYDIPLLHRQMLEILGIEGADKIVPTDDDLKPADPVTETMNIINGEPVKAFIYQDHEAHIQAHMMAAENPQLQQMMEKNPQAKAVMAAGAAHIAEHVAFLFRKKVEEELGAPLPGVDEPLPEDIELRISRLAAPAIAQLTGKAQQQKQAEENARKQEDPIIQMEQEKLRQSGEKISGDKEAKDKKLSNDLTVALERIGLEKAKLAQKASIDNQQLDQTEAIEGAKLVVKAEGDLLDSRDKEQQRIATRHSEGLRLGMELAQNILQGIRDDNQSE